MLVTQRSILRSLEIFCVTAEENGAVTSIEKCPEAPEFVYGRLDLADTPVKLRFDRDTSKGKFAPYTMTEL